MTDQLAMFEPPAESKIDASTLPVLAVAERDNADLMVDCARLGYLDGLVVDVTYGLGRFWTKHRPDLFFAYDLDPARAVDGVERADCRHLPLHDRSVDTVVFDPPYKLNGTSTGKGAAASDAAYGVAGRYVPAAERHALLLDGTSEALRVARRYVLVKCQDQISSSRYHPQTFLVWRHAVTRGAGLVDLIHVVGGRPQPPGRRQVHSSRNYSSLLVFEVA